MQIKSTYSGGPTSSSFDNPRGRYTPIDIRKDTSKERLPEFVIMPEKRQSERLRSPEFSPNKAGGSNPARTNPQFFPADLF